MDTYQGSVRQSDQEAVEHNDIKLGNQDELPVEMPSLNPVNLDTLDVGSEENVFDSLTSSTNALMVSVLTANLVLSLSQCIQKSS